MNGLVLDAGALIAIDRDERAILLLLARSAELGQRVSVPTTVMAQAIRNPAKQARLRRFFRGSTVDLIPLTEADATAVGILLAKTSTNDIVDAHVVVCARRTGQSVVTSDPGDIRKLAPELQLVRI